MVWKTRRLEVCWQECRNY